MKPRRYTSRDLAIPAEVLAPKLIGAVLRRTLPDGMVLTGRIVETEAYMGADDRCSHAYNGRRTPRNEAMYGRAGLAYVYFTYGMHHCVNVVCGEEGVAVAVLIRALEPLTGLEAMRRLRGGRKNLRDRDLCSGPGKLCQALAIDRALNAADLTADGPLTLLHGPSTPVLVNAPRIGVGDHEPWSFAPLRWYDPRSGHVSVRSKSEH